jgi:hypothetical protein
MLVALRRQTLLLDARLAYVLAGIGGVFFTVQSWIYAHTQASLLDEGAYLVTGYLFASGSYRPFQDYGPWNNQMPLSFLIPGFFQVLFGPGLRTGRYLAILLGVLMLVGLWLAARRLGGAWWAAGAVFAMAANPAVIKMYSVMASQVIIACLLVWTLALTLGENRPLWQLLLGGILAASMALARLNLIPVLPLLLGYIFWQHGRQAGIWAGLAGIAVLLGGHALIWPGVLRMWAAWIPTGLAPFLETWRSPAGTPVWNPIVGLENRLLSFLFGFRFHFLPLVGVLAALFLWPRRAEWQSESRFRASVFLAVLFIVLFLAHAWASLGINTQTYDALGRNYCVFCFPVYLAFFSALGILLVVSSAGSWRRMLPGWLQLAIAGLVVILSLGLGYSAFDTLGDIWLDWRVPRLRTLFTTGELLPGYVPLWEYLKNNAGLAYNQARRLLPALAGLAVGLGILATALVAGRTGRREKKDRDSSAAKEISGFRPAGVNSNPGFGPLALVLFLLAGWFLSPSPALGAGYRNYDCGGDMIHSFETVGKELADSIPAGSKVYWQGGLSPAPLLYLRGIEIYPPQLNAGYSFRIGGEPDELLRYGFWNQEIAEGWLGDSDFVLVQERFYEGWLKDVLEEPGRYAKVKLTPSTLPCRDDARIYVFRRDS